MCGICAVWLPKRIDATAIECQELRKGIGHRGPDGEGQVDFSSQGLSIGHTRLSIVDLSGSPQPMTSACGRYTISFNGEIFNFRQLRQHLDYPFVTDGDTETLLALWAARGASGLSDVRGQFAFLIWDALTLSLSLAVDAFGILPLYVAESVEELFISSSATSLALALGKRVTSDRATELLMRRAIVAPGTPWSGISRLEPGALWEYRQGQVTKARWWTPPQSAAPLPRKDSSTKVVEYLLRQSASRAITADVEVGIFLSGGIDSAIVAKLASDFLPYRLKAYTADWGIATQASELASATQTAETLGLEHIVVEVSAAAWWQALKSGSAYRDAPMSEPADAVFYLLSERAAQDVKVVLTGEGADELFGGYPKYRAEALTKLPLLHRAFSALRGPLAHIRSHRLLRIVQALGERDPRVRFLRYFSTDLDNPEMLHAIARRESARPRGVMSMRLWDIQNYLAPLLLDRADRMAMAHGLEVRPLFLDLDIAQMALTLRTSSLISPFGTKRLLRRTARRLLPHQLTHRAKRGFPLPLALWLRTDLRNDVRSTLSQPSVFLDPVIGVDRRLRILEEHLTGARDHALALFTLVSIMVWTEALR